MTRSSCARRVCSLTILACLLVCLGLGTSRQETTIPLLDGSSRGAAAPFQDGERVRYEVNWRALPFMPAIKAGEVDFEVRRDELEGLPVYRITARARSMGFLASLGLKIEDDFESTVDARTLRTLRFVHRKRHNKKKRDLELKVDYEAGHADLREVERIDDPARTIRQEKIKPIPPDLSDVVSVFYAGRVRELEPGRAYSIHLHDNGQIKPVRVHVEARESVRSGLDVHDSVRVRTEEGIFKGAGHFLIWYSRDELRLPVRFEASAKLGRVFGQLIHVESPRFSKTRIRVS